MTEVIDSFRPRNIPGRSKAVTLFVLTTIGSFGKLIIIGLWVFLMVALESSFGDSGGKEVRWMILAGVLVILFGLINFVGSLLMLKRIKAGLWVYLVSQVLSVWIITYTTVSVSHKLDTGAQFFIGFVWIISGVFIALYFSNREYYNRQPPVDDAFFENESEDTTPPSQYPEF